MIVPEFWAEGKVRGKVDGHQVTVRRFGWSDISQEAAQAHAEERAAHAFQEIAAGEMVEKYERKAAYNGTTGVPIREEILARHGEAVITRNLYGARCLNSPDVLFADVDADQSVPSKLSCGFYVASLVLAVAAGFIWQSVGVATVVILAGLVLGFPVTRLVFHLYQKKKGGPRGHAYARIQRFAERHPDWHLRVYETPAGYRIMVMHRAFDPMEPAVEEMFTALEADPIYVRMCKNQRCFRARLSPKPWRIGIRDHIRPQPGYWPVKEVHLPARNRWITLYEEKARNYAACRYVESLGSREVHPTAEALLIIHDELCQAHKELPLA